MNIEFHYYITKYIALEAGFAEDEAEIIAHSSQLVDDNYISYQCRTPSGETYQNFATQTRDIAQPDTDQMRKYLLFHYLPGDPTDPRARRKDGKMHLLMTTPASSFAQDIFFETTKNESLYSLGIASHMISDTLSHQNFVGMPDEVNSLRDSEGNLHAVIGHQDLGDKPDIPNLIWHDPRLIDRYTPVDNLERLLLAANKLYTNFVFMTSYPAKWSTVKKNITAMIGPRINETQKTDVNSPQSRVSKYQELLSGFGGAAEYTINKWLQQAVKEDINSLKDPDTTLTLNPDYEKTDWFRFQEAVKMYLHISESKLEPLFSQVDIPNW